MNLQDNTIYTIVERDSITAKFLLKRDCKAFYEYLKTVKVDISTVKVYEFDKEIDITA